MRDLASRLAIAAVVVLHGACGGSPVASHPLGDAGPGNDASDATSMDAAANGDAGTSGDAATGVDAASGDAAHMITNCSALPAVGVWQQITPSGIDLSGFGVNNVVLDPSNPASMYVGTSTSGMWKSSDCGATFVKINTGALSAELSAGGMQALIDPVNADIIYTHSLYGENGFFKSTDGAVNFKQILTPNITMYAPDGGFVGSYDMDPTNHLHLLVSWHNVCGAPYNSSCYAETLDGGVTWTMRNGDSSWTGGEGSTLNFLDSKRWLFSSSSNGLWLSKDSGTTWAQVPNAQVAHGSGQLVRMPDGSFFVAAENGILYSHDGESWGVIANSGSLLQGLASDGKTIWTSQAFPYNVAQRPSPAERYWQSSTADNTSWTPMMNAPSLSSGACWLSYDSDHHILYSANYWDGLWRVVIK